MCSAGHGGRILLSTAARDALDVAQLSRIAGISVSERWAGIRSRDCSNPEALFQVNATDLRARFPKARVAAVRGPAAAGRRS